MSSSSPSSSSFTETSLSQYPQQQQQSLSMRFVEGIRHLVDDHDVFLLDMWGVLHDGSVPYQGVLDTIRRLKDAGKEMVILSNSSKRKESSIRALTKLGFDTNDFSMILTSGELSFRMLSGDDSLQCQTWSLLSDIRARDATPKVFVFGSGLEDEEYCTSAGWTLAPVEQADLLLARGTFTVNDGSGKVIDKNKNEQAYLEALNYALRQAASRSLPMLVSNPDKVRPDEGLPPMPGAIGDMYEDMLGGGQAVKDELVKRIGKPYPEVFEMALQGKDSSRACMIGDALETDVTGGTLTGVTTVWVIQDGIHGPTVREKGSYQEGVATVLSEFNMKDGTYAKDLILKPSVVVPNFRW